MNDYKDSFLEVYSFFERKIPSVSPLPTHKNNYIYIFNLL